MALGILVVVCQGSDFIFTRLSQLTDRRDDVRVESTRRFHHLPEQVLPVDPGSSIRREPPLGMEQIPYRRVCEVGREVDEEGRIHGDFAPLELVPCTIGRGFHNRVVYVAWWDSLAPLVVTNGEHG